MFDYTERTAELRQRLLAFMDEHIYPNEAALLAHEHGPERWQTAPLIETLKEKAKQQGLWNLFLPESELGAGLSNLDYAHLCEIMGRSPFAPEVFNCAAPDTATWKCWPATARRSRSSAGYCPCWPARSVPVFP